MTQEEQRIAMAKIHGWRELNDATNNCVAPNGFRHFVSDWREIVPDYPNDLNAIQEVWDNILNWEDKRDTIEWLKKLSQDSRGQAKPCPFHAFASAPKRVEAILRAVNEWQEGGTQC